MAPQRVNITFELPQKTQITISTGNGEPDPEEAIKDMGKTVITSGKYKGQTFTDAALNSKYRKWITCHKEKLTDTSLSLTRGGRRLIMS